MDFPQLPNQLAETGVVLSCQTQPNNHGRHALHRRFVPAQCPDFRQYVHLTLGTDGTASAKGNN